jgi:phosphatidylserine/phosphatidylglycerophosphate/cardiolipin synthase-like enzyme
MYLLLIVLLTSYRSIYSQDLNQPSNDTNSINNTLQDDSGDQSYQSDGSSIDTNSKIYVSFSPLNKIEDNIIKNIDEAQHYIYIAAYEFTSKRIAMALVNADKRGVDEKIVADYKTNIDSKYSTLKLIKNQSTGINIRLNDKYLLLHDKFMIIDDYKVETGSYNYTEAAKNNAENAIFITDNAAITVAYKNEFIRLWNEASKRLPATDNANGLSSNNLDINKPVVTKKEVKNGILTTSSALYDASGWLEDKMNLDE